MRNKISLAGDLGSGKSSVLKQLAPRLNAGTYSTGTRVRELAAARGMTVRDFNAFMETHPEIDGEIDAPLRALSDDPRPLLIDSRMAWYFTRDTFKVYLSCAPEVSAARIMAAGRQGDGADTLAQMLENNRARRESERRRYRDLYGTDICDMSNYHIVIDTTSATEAQVADAVYDSYTAWRAHGWRNPRGMLCPGRLRFPDDAADMGKVCRLAAALECGESLPPVSVFEQDCEYYVQGGVCSALAYALAGATYVPCRLVRGTVGDRRYVCVQNSL